MLGLFLFAAFAAVLSVVLWLRADTAARTADLVESTPTTPIGELCEGLFEAKGAVRPCGELLTSPFKQQPCVHYRFVVKEERTTGTGKHRRTRTVTVVNDARSAPFVLTDGTGEVRVDFQQATLQLAPDSHGSSGFLKDAPPELDRLLRTRYGRTTQDWVFNKSMTYQETVLCAGDELYVLGRVQVVDGELRFTGGGEVFLVSDGSEESVLDSFRSSARWCRVGSLLCGAGALAGCALSVLGAR